MAKYVLDKLLDIREKREDDLVHQVAAAKAAVVEAQTLVVQAMKKLKDFEKEKPSRQNKLYAAVMNQIVQRKQLDALKVALSDLEREHMAMRDAVTQAEENLKQKQQQQEQLQQELIAASKNKMKLDMHKEEWLAEDRKQEEYKAEAEAEDVSRAIAPIGEDDDSI